MGGPQLLPDDVICDWVAHVVFLGRFDWASIVSTIWSA